MKRTVQMTETEFNGLVEIKSIEDMAEKELEKYTEIFVDTIKEQFDCEENTRTFWCPKCESPHAIVEIDKLENRGMANCTHCRIAVVIISSDAETE